MSDDNSTTGVVDSPAADGGSVGGGVPDDQKNPFSKLSNPSSGSKTYRIGPDGFDIGGKHIVLDYMVAEGRTPRTKERGWIKAGSAVTIAGKLGNLRTFDRAALWIGQTRRQLLGVKFENYQIIFKIPDNISQSISANGTIAVELGNGKESGILSDFLVYKPVEKKEEKKEESSGGKGVRTGGKKGADDKFGKGAMDTLVNVTGETLQKSLGAMVGIGASGKTSVAQSKQVKQISAQASKSSSSTKVMEESSSDYEETAGGDILTSINGEENVTASAEVQSQTEVKVSGEVTGEVASGVSTGVSAINRYENIKATTDVTAAGSSGSATGSVTGSVTGAVGGEGQVSVEGGGVIAETATQTVGGGEAVEAVLNGDLALRQSMEAVGEYLEKNPGLIPDSQVKGRVIQALSSGKSESIQNLDLQSKIALQNTLQVSFPTDNPQAQRLKLALQNVNSVIANSSQTMPAASGGVVLGGAKQSQAMEPKQEGVVEGTVGNGSGEMGQKNHQAVQSKLQHSVPAEPEVKPELPTQQGKPQTPQEKEDKNLVQAGAQASIPPQYAAMIGALAEKDKAREAVGSGAAKSTPKQGKGESIGSPNTLLGQDKLPAGPDKAKFEGKQAGGGVPASLAPTSGQAQEKKNSPKPKGPLNPEALAQPPTKAQEEANQPGKTGGAKEVPQVGQENSESPQQDEQETPAETARPETAGQFKAKNKTKEGLSKAAGYFAGKATSKAWYWGFGIAGAVFFSGMDFMIGAIIMDAYWFFGHRKNRDLFPLKGWQKAVTMMANLLPFVWASFFFGIALFLGCNFPPSLKDHETSVLGLAGYGDVCKSFMSFPAGLTGALKGEVTGQPTVPVGGGSCSPVQAGPASVANLQSTCFGYNANYASSISNAESGGITTRASNTDKCGNDSVSWGLFQINITAHAIGGYDCPKAFDRMFTGNSSACNVINRTLYDQCVQAAQDPGLNIQEACQISSNGTKWSAWGANKKCGF